MARRGLPNVGFDYVNVRMILLIGFYGQSVRIDRSENLKACSL